MYLSNSQVEISKSSARAIGTALTQELQAVHHLVDGLARAMHADADEIQRIGCCGGQGGTVVGVVGGLEHRLDVDRGYKFARQRPLMGAAKLLERGAIDEHRLADQR